MYGADGQSAKAITFQFDRTLDRYCSFQLACLRRAAMPPLEVVSRRSR